MSPLRNWRGFAIWPACVLLLAARAAGDTGGSVEQLLAAGRLQAQSILSPAGGIVPGQKVTLTLVIATDRWFSGGSRITIPEIPGLVILQTQQFASNSSETRSGENWVVQRWALDIYPQRAGQFTVGPVPVRVKVNGGEAGDLEGELRTNTVSFGVGIPQHLAQAEHWVAAPAFEARQSFDRSLEALQVGDAFEREIVFEASDVLAMMLPAVDVGKTPGLATYPSPPVLNNSSNRGQTRASRIQRISYVVESQGTYQLPAMDYFWWDTETSELRLLSLPATEFSVGAGATARAGSALEALQLTAGQLTAAIAILLLLAAALRLACKRMPGLPTARAGAAVSALWHKLQELRKPALPSQLNPGSSAGE